ncbi:hypothetical protein [Morganella morganii]|uniref:GAP1-N1 domain-containing protein n=1 Tax=Morganella morganii TaxID=582 RepID=UPI0013CA504C|nr:hypothetical protein [Morganella morganii]NGE93736.1 hypothetical protein [Morganella morganii]
MKIDQCLFGYDDGHRLLASSLPLGAETSLLTELSDLAPGAVFGCSEGYWTGLPAPQIGRYALMHTWPAPEMSRPGCVWTHALLIDPVLLESIDDLSVLQTIMSRPKSPIDKDRYREPIDVTFSSGYYSNSLLDDSYIRKLIISLYETNNMAVEIASPGELDDALFAVWSQQWPRLRRNFRFQTAASREYSHSISTRFDVNTVLASRESGIDTSENNTSSWLSIAAQDVKNGLNGTLRPFLWRYGRDVRRQRGSFRPLVEINIFDCEIKINSLNEIISIVYESFPTQGDAYTLKQDLIDGVLMSHAQAKWIKFLVKNEGGGNGIFPLPTPEGMEKLKKLWPQQSDEILQLVEISAGTEKPLGKFIFENVINIVQTPEFWPLTELYPYVRQLIVKTNPSILTDSDYILETKNLVELIPLVPENTQHLKSFVSRLMSRNDEELISVVIDKFPKLTAIEVVLLKNDRNIELGDLWFQRVISRPDLILQTEVMGLISKASVLYEVAEKLGWISSRVITFGVTPWNAALINISNDIQEHQEDTLKCFLLVLAFKSNNEDGYEIIEKFYKDIHSKILKSKLSKKANEILSTHLPELSWLLSCNLGPRFRLAVADAYVRHKWPPQSYAKLADSSKERDLLASAASEISGGYMYFKAVL